MKTFLIGRGLVIKWQEATLEFVHREPDALVFRDVLTNAISVFPEAEFWNSFRARTLQVIEAISTPTQLTYEEGAEDSPHGVQQTLHQLPEKWQEDVDRKAKYIAALFRLGISRGQRGQMQTVLHKIAKQIGDEDVPPAPSTVGKWMSDVEKANGDISVTVSGFATRERRKSTGPAHEELIQESISHHYLTRERRSKTASHSGYLRDLKTENRARAAASRDLLIPVSYSTYVRRIEELPKYDVAVSRYGAQIARRRFNMIEGHLPASHPLDYVEIDHTVVNLYVVDDESFMPLGRPWLTAIKDRFSKMLLGLFLSFTGPSVQSVFGALRHSLEGHHLATRLWPDIENPWASSGLGATYVSDRGSDFLAIMYRMAIRALGAEYQYCERRTPWHKASIERFFQTVETTFFESIAGKTFRSLAERGDYDPAKTAVVRFSVLVYLIHKWAADFHNASPDRMTGARPIDLWNEGIVIAPPSLPANLDQLDVVLGNTCTGRISHEGLRYGTMTYADRYLRDLMGHVGPGARVTFSVPPNDLGYAYVFDPRHKINVPVANTRPEYASGLSLFQHQWLKKICREKYKEVNVDRLIEVRGEISDRVREELQAKSVRSKERLARLAGINSHAVLSGEARTILDPFGLPGNPQPSQTTSPVSVSDVRRPSWRLV
ncbi:transposase [Paraburkholderia acidicola]|uniref:Transposase n=1 Tax=Paraburkholderia acidicola TaxID=1912599 RepID=A0ABV1LLL3_9BURK